MVEKESDNESVESGSCTCSDYDPDCSWFYDSRNLGTSYMRICILSDKDNIIIKNEKSRPMTDNRKINSNKINEIKKDLFENKTNKRKNVIKLTNSSSVKNQNTILDAQKAKSKFTDNNNSKFTLRRKKNENIELLVDNNKNNKLLRQTSDKFNRKTHNDLNINSKKTDFFPINVDEYEHNYSAPIENMYSHNKNLTNMHNMYRSPINYSNKRRHIFNINQTEEIKNKKGNFFNNISQTEELKNKRRKIFNQNDEKTNKFDLEMPKTYNSPRINLYKTFSNMKYFNNDDNNDEKINDNNESNVIHKNFQSKGRTIKEKIVKETKNITLEPGQTIKPRIITKRKLKPHTTIVKNDDGTENIIIENTTLTTVIVNEMVDDSKLYNDKYPLDVQLVKQYITKIYKTEIENNPYRSKKEF
jgi:hypothetical protein